MGIAPAALEGSGLGSASPLNGRGSDYHLYPVVQQLSLNAGMMILAVVVRRYLGFDSRAPGCFRFGLGSGRGAALVIIDGATREHCAHHG